MECPTRKPAAELVVWKKQGDGQTTDSDKPEKFVCKVNTVLLAVHSQAFTGEHLLWPLCSTELWILPGYFWQAPVTYPDWLSVFGMKRCCYFFWQVVLRIKPCSNLMSYFKFDFFFWLSDSMYCFFFFPKHFFTRLRSPVDYDFWLLYPEILSTSQSHPDLHLTFSNRLPPNFPTALLQCSHQNVHILVLTAAGPNKKCFICLLFASCTPVSATSAAQQTAALYPAARSNKCLHQGTCNKASRAFKVHQWAGKKPLVTALLWLFSVVGSCGRGKKANPLPGEHEPCSSRPSRISLYQQLCIFWQIMNSCHWNSNRRKRDM